MDSGSFHYRGMVPAPAHQPIETLSALASGQGAAPSLVGARVTITREADDDWRREREADHQTRAA
jgi:hypothetical protein